jgi:pyrimidine deaminase RibD-like protein
MTHLDRERLAQALALAEQAIGLSEPNPRVGCVIGLADGRVLATGHTQAAGQAHAEAAALAQARERGLDVRGATAWVTLEPCAHHGRTPPCADALVAAGLARVVVGVGDPFDQVAGRGISRLRAAGIQVDEATSLGLDDLALACRELEAATVLETKSSATVVERMATPLMIRSPMLSGLTFEAAVTTARGAVTSFETLVSKLPTDKRAREISKVVVVAISMGASTLDSKEYVPA